MLLTASQTASHHLWGEPCFPSMAYRTLSACIQPVWPALVFLSLLGHCQLQLLFITLIVLWILKNPCIPGIKPTWSWCMIFLIYCWILFARILLRIFASMFISDTSFCLKTCFLPNRPYAVVSHLCKMFFTNSNANSHFYLENLCLSLESQLLCYFLCEAFFFFKLHLGRQLVTAPCFPECHLVCGLLTYTFTMF